MSEKQCDSLNSAGRITPRDRYILHYIELHRRYGLDVGVRIAFWYGAPVKRQQRLKLDSELIYRTLLSTLTSNVII